MSLLTLRGISLTQATKDELTAIFPTTFNSSGTADYQTTTTSGYEFEAVANLTRTWALSLRLLFMRTDVPQSLEKRIVPLST